MNGETGRILEQVYSIVHTIAYYVILYYIHYNSIVVSSIVLCVRARARQALPARKGDALRAAARHGPVRGGPSLVCISNNIYNYISTQYIKIVKLLTISQEINLARILTITHNFR